MRLIALALATLLLLIQYPLWLGKGGWLRVWELDRQVSQVQMHNEGLKERNGKLESEVEDLKTGTGAVEERARFELGMIKKDEIFVQILDAGTAPQPVSQATIPPASEAPARAAKEKAAR
ncbi:MAG: cell division protein FtsB [Pseudomonadota bacterium]